MSLSLITDFTERGSDPDFPFAKIDWSREFAIDKAHELGLDLSDDHWELVNALQSYFSQHGDKRISLRLLHDALDERFHQKGGLKYLYTLFPGGPISQACGIAGIAPPPGAVNLSFGSVS
ncbi:TusE/DsrC/DsvC family sulfur relay protein [Beggiatoa alba]|nr:TusE/DsrC/DsvC family sulfur relay protein [Beggiatoa alba]